MVRIKHRWLLVQVLYPGPATQPQASSDQDSAQVDRPSLLGAPSPTLSIHAPTPDSIRIPTLLQVLRTRIELLFGDYGSGFASGGLVVKYWSNATSTFILRCDRAVFRLVWAAVTFVRALPLERGGPRRKAGDVDELPCVMQVLRVSGTIRKCEEELIRRAKALCGRVTGLALARKAGVTMGEAVTVSDDDGDDDAMYDRGNEDAEDDQSLDND